MAPIEDGSMSTGGIGQRNAGQVATDARRKTGNIMYESRLKSAWLWMNANSRLCETGGCSETAQLREK
ncbi:hypothetical protein ACNKHX_00050 [Shigella flexneri]